MELSFKKLSKQIAESEKVQTFKENLNPYFAEKMVLTEVNTMKDFKRYGERNDEQSASETEKIWLRKVKCPQSPNLIPLLQLILITLAM
jgi:hypothetical protein